MRILFLSHYGANPQFQEFFSAVAKAGNDVKVVLPKEIIYTNGYRPQTWPERSTVNEVEYIPGKLVDPKRYHLSGYWPELFLTILKFKPQVVVVTDEVYTVDTLWVTIFKLLLLRRYKIVTWSQAHYLEDAQAIPQRAGRLLLWWNKRWVHRFVARNQLQAGRIRKAMRTKDRVQHVYWSSNPQRFQRSAKTKAELLADFGLDNVLAAKRIIGFVGRVVREKGISDVIQSLPGLPADAVFAVVGSGHADYIAECKQLAEQLGVAHRVVWVGDKPYDQLVQFYNLVDLIVLPTKNHNNFYELFGRVLAEAMMCKTMVLGSTNGAIPEVISNDQCIFPQGDQMALQAKLEQLLNLSTHDRAQLIERQYQHAVANFTVEAFARNLLALCHA